MEDRTLWHYTSSDAFAKIISTKKIWLSSMKVANDSREGRLVGAALKRLAKAANIQSDQMEDILRNMSFFEERMDGLSFCLSKKADSLGQWRGYADDGNGFSIGFSERVLREAALKSLERIEAKGFGFYFREVHYSDADHEKVVLPAFLKLQDIWKEGGSSKTNRLAELLLHENPQQLKTVKAKTDDHHHKMFSTFYSLIGDLYCLKASAFSEEQECRLISSLFLGTDDPISTCKHYGKRSQLVPYREFELTPTVNPIQKIFIGPKNITPKPIVENLLCTNGFSNVIVERSASSYR